VGLQHEFLPELAKLVGSSVVPHVNFSALQEDLLVDAAPVGAVV